MGTDKNGIRKGQLPPTTTTVPPPGAPDTQDNMIYMQVPKMTLADLVKVGRIKIDLNEEEISLIYVTATGSVHATQAKCPHAGGPLHLADIEDLSADGGGGLCIRCPWHSWKFNLKTGECVCPPAGHGRKIHVYPVRISGQEIRIGFQQIASEYFQKPPD